MKMEIPLMIPARSKLNLKLFSVPSTMRIGKGCRLHGNIRAGSIDVQQNTVIFGSLRAKNRITVVDGVTGTRECGERNYRVREKRSPYSRGRDCKIPRPS